MRYTLLALLATASLSASPESDKARQDQTDRIERIQLEAQDIRNIQDRARESVNTLLKDQLEAERNVARELSRESQTQTVRDQITQAIIDNRR